jgi:hypothetical protein
MNKKNYWKIKNVTSSPVNFVAALPMSGSKGVLLNPNETIIVEAVRVNGIEVKTATLGVQERRRVVEIQSDFDNDFYKLEINKNLKTTDVESAIKFAEAERNAEGYMKS